MQTPLLRVLLVVSVCLGVGAAGAESSLVLPLPAKFGSIPAQTFGPTGEWLGDAHIQITRLEDGHVRIEGRSGIDQADHTIVTAELAPVNGSGPVTGLRPIRQTSQSFNAAGHAMGKLSIDHINRVGICAPGANEDGEVPEPRTIELPKDDRVANVPLNLLFRPLALGDSELIKFQVLLCSGGPRIVTAQASVVPADTVTDTRKLVQVRYELSLPKFLARIASRFLPRLSFWFDGEGDGAWVAHQMPLYSKGPTVLVVRGGLTPSDLPGSL